MGFKKINLFTLNTIYISAVCIHSIHFPFVLHLIEFECQLHSNKLFLTVLNKYNLFILTITLSKGLQKIPILGS